MTNIALIGCTSQKKDTLCKAEEMYSPSNYFNLRLEYARLLKIQYIYILSAKYGLIERDKMILPYNLNLKETSKEYKDKWNLSVFTSLNLKHNINKDTFFLLCGKEYRDFLEKHLKYTINPIPKNCRIGCQLKFYKEEIERLKNER